MTSVISVIAVVCLIVLLFSIIKAIVRSVRTFTASRKMGIIKACIQPVGAAVSIVSTIVMVILLFYMSGKVSEARNSALEWEQIKAAGYSEQFEYLNDMLSSSTGTEITDFNKFSNEQISIYNDRAYYFTHICTIVLITAVLMFTSFFEKIFYLTESGLLSAVLKEPEEFVVRRGNKKLGVYFKSGPNSSRYLVEFRETPDNVAKLGRFIKWEKTEADIAEN